ncbi:MAG: hypothetical protein WAV76_12790 [Bacteroidota bacterium]
MKNRIPMRTSLQGIAKKIYAEASVVEDPSAEKPHAGIRAGGVEQSASLPRSSKNHRAASR